MSHALVFICAALVFVATTKGTPLNYLEARGACIPGSLGSVKQKDRVLGRLPAPG